jgi:hypothetical protein
MGPLAASPSASGFDSEERARAQSNLEVDALARVGQNALLNCRGDTAHLMASLTTVSLKLRPRCSDRDDGCVSAAALARRSGADMGLSIERCAQLGLK